MRKITSLLLAGCALCLITLSGPAQSQAADEAAIHAVVQGESDAWNRGDSAAFGARFAENGSFTNILGQQLYGRKAFVAQHEAIFTTIYKGSRNTLSVGKIIFVRPDVAVVDIDGALSGVARLPPGIQAGPDGALHVKLQQVMTKEKGEWWIASFHNVAVLPLPPGGPPK